MLWGMLYCLRHCRVNDDQLPTVIDASAVGNVSRFLNHSCRPNVKVVDNNHKLMELVKARGVFPIIFKASRNILKGEELCINYHPDGCAESSNYDISRKIPCLCGSGAQCRGWLPATWKLVLLCDQHYHIIYSPGHVKDIFWFPQGIDCSTFYSIHFFAHVAGQLK